MTNIDKLEIICEDKNIVGTEYGNLFICDPYKYRKVGTHNTYVKCKCICGNEMYTQLGGLKNGHTKSCGHCHDNYYTYINDYLSILKIYDTLYDDWVDILVNTNCVEYLLAFGQWYINYHKNSVNIHKPEIRGVNHNILHRVIVQYINSQYNLQPLTNDLEIDHISGNTFNNLYYPFDDEISRYYNNLRMCTRRQNGLNRPCKIYHYEPRGIRHYRTVLEYKGVIYRNSFLTPQECIPYNNKLIYDLSPEDAKFYYFHQTNPRNDPTTFSNTILNAIGYNEDVKYSDTDFVDEI